MEKPGPASGKKDREKAKAAKQREKKEKAEKRKENSARGQSLEDMMAYVDEYGNISSTPPGPASGPGIAQEDIRIGVAKRPTEVVELVRKGMVSFFDESKGFGFIIDAKTEEKFFVHIKNIDGPVKGNDYVTFETEKDARGFHAIKVRKENAR